MSDSLLGDWGRNIGNWIASGKNKRDAERAARDRSRTWEGLDHQPQYSADLIGDYKQTNSPVARAYIESFLLGQNPDATFSGEANASFKKAAQQRTQDNLFGTMAQRQAEGKAAREAQPWAVTTPDRKIGGFVPAYDKLNRALERWGYEGENLTKAASSLMAKYGAGAADFVNGAGSATKDPMNNNLAMQLRRRSTGF